MDGRPQVAAVDGRYDVIHFHLPYARIVGKILVVQSLPRESRPKLCIPRLQAGARWKPRPCPHQATIGLDDALVTVSEGSRQALPRHLRGRAQVVIHGVDVSQFAQLRTEKERIRREVRQELGVRPDDVLILTVANLLLEKGYDILLEAARMLVAEAYRFRCGHGPLADDLNRIHTDLGLGDRFRFSACRRPPSPDRRRCLHAALPS